MPPLTPGNDQPAERDENHSGPYPSAPPPGTAGLIPTQRAPQEQDSWQVLLPHQRRLLALAITCGATPDTARDVVQEALLRTAARTRLDAACVAGYLSVVVCRLVTDQHRIERRQQELARNRRLELPSQPGPEETICQQAEAAWLQQQTARLPERERRALLLRGSGRTTSQIATEFGITPKAVELLIRRGRATLRRLLVGTLSLLLMVPAATKPATTHRPARPPIAARSHSHLLAPLTVTTRTVALTPAR